MKLRYLFILAFMAIMALQTDVSAQINIFPTYTEDFETTNGNWTASGTSSTWAWGTPSYSYITTAGSGTKCWKTNLTGTYNVSETSYLTSPAFNFSCFTADPTITFLISHQVESGYDYCVLQSSIDGGTTFTNVGSNTSGGTNWYQTASGFNGARTWTSASHLLTGLAGQANVILRFRFTSDNSVQQTGVGIDLVNITLPGATLTVPTLTAPVDGANGVVVAPTLSWNTVTCATAYDVQVSTDAAFTAPVVNMTGLATASTIVGPLAGSTLYYWRVRSTRGAIISNWSPVRTFTTLFPPPPVPVLISPVNNSTAQAISALSLTWQASVGAASYRVQVSKSATFAPLLVDSSVTSTSLTLNGLENYTVYYWRVSATNISGSSAYSLPWNFRTLIASTTLASPPNNNIELKLPPVLTWNAFPGVLGYRLQVSTDLNFTNVIFDNPNVTTNSLDIPGLLNNQKYYWRVQCNGTGGETSNWSPVWAFSTIIATPVLTLPLDGAVDVPVAAPLAWNAVNGTVNYQVQISTNIVFIAGTVLYDNSSITTPSTTAANLTGNTTYFWRVRGTNATTGTGLWSEVRSFRTITGVTALQTPTNKASAITLPVTLQWSAVSPSAIYQVQVSTEQTFATPLINEEKLAATSILYNAFNGLKNNTTYYWRVRPYSQSGTDIPWTATWSFTTIIGQVTATAPANNTKDYSKDVTFTWNALDGATGYALQVSKDKTFATLDGDYPNVTGTSKSVSLETSTAYYWRVRGLNVDNGPGAWSATWNFTTSASAAAVPSLDVPANNAVKVPNDMTFNWKAAVGAITYEFQLSSAADFANAQINQSGLTETSYKAIGLAASTKYYWRVRSVNSAGPSAWSETWSFTVVAAAPVMTSLGQPANNAKNQPKGVTLKWNATAGAATYQIQVSEMNDFSTTVDDNATLTTTAFTPAALKNSTTYYWHVRAANEGGNGAWSETWSFSTEAAGGVAEDAQTGLKLESYPNPVVHGTASIIMDLPTAGFAQLSVVNVLGMNVLDITYAHYEAGKHTIAWDASLAPGLYFLHLEFGNTSLNVPVTITAAP